LKVIPETRPYH